MLCHGHPNRYVTLQQISTTFEQTSLFVPSNCPVNLMSASFHLPKQEIQIASEIFFQRFFSAQSILRSIALTVNNVGRG